MDDDTVVPMKKKTGEKKRKAPKAPSMELEPTEDVPAEPSADQEVPVKSKKKKAPKVAVDDEPIVLEEEPVKSKKKKAPKKIVVDDEPITLEEESVKKKKSKAPKPPPVDDDFQMIDAPTIEEFDAAPIEEKPAKVKKPKKSKKKTPPPIDEPANYELNSENYVNATTADEFPPMENNSSEYERAILDTYAKLASSINFAEYVGNDQWCIIHLPKTARTEPKSRIRKMLPGGNKDDKLTSKPPVPKGSLLSRFRSGMNSLVRDEKNLIFGERGAYDLGEEDDDPDGVDTDDLHRYAQKLRELEDQDREVNPEFLVLRDGKTVYGVHESDADGKIKLATRKPIYDRQADQKPDEQSTKKTIMSYLKNPFGRNKEVKDSKSANTTPDSHLRRKSSRKSLNDALTPSINDEPLNV